MAEVTTLARPYAKAAFEYALAQQSLSEWTEMLALAADIAADKQVMSLLNGPSLTTEQQAEFFVDICQKSINDAMSNFVRILAENKRLIILPEIAEIFEQLKAQQEAILDVVITSALPLAEDRQNKLVSALKARFGQEINLTTAVDQNLLGGVEIRAGDLVIDGSIRGKLNKLAEAMNS